MNEAIDKKWKEIENTPYGVEKKEDLMNQFVKGYDREHKDSAGQG